MNDLKMETFDKDHITPLCEEDNSSVGEDVA